MLQLILTRVDKWPRSIIDYQVLSVKEDLMGRLNTYYLLEVLYILSSIKHKDLLKKNVKTCKGKCLADKTKSLNIINSW